MNIFSKAVIWLILIATSLMAFGFLERTQKSGLLINHLQQKRSKKHSIGILDKLLHGYNRGDPPMKHRPTEVRLGIYISSFDSISVQSMDYSMSFYLRLSWRDPRLAFPPIDGRINVIHFTQGRWDEIWTPDIFFRNEKRSTIPSITGTNRLLRLNSTGHVWYVQKISTTLGCPMQLGRYPMDTQYCSILFESFGFTMDTMYFSWMDSPVDVDPSNQFPQYSLAGQILYDCSQDYTAGAFPCLEIRFVFQRALGYYLLRMYMPSGLIVVLSWVPFFNMDKVAERLSLGLVIILTMTMWDTGSQGSLPRVSYITALDVWTSCCLIFVFASLIEVGIVNLMSQKPEESSMPVTPTRSPSLSLSLPMASDNQSTDLDIEMQMDEEMKEKYKVPRLRNSTRKKKALNVDKISRIGFPLAFLLFNVVYWTFYNIIV